VDRIKEDLKMEMFEEKIKPEFLKPDPAEMGLDDRIDFWYGRTALPANYDFNATKSQAPPTDLFGQSAEEESWEPIETPSELEPEPLRPISTEEGPDRIPQVSLYKDLITTAPAYHWLLENIQKELLLTSPEPDVQAAIRKKLLEAMPSSGSISRGAAPEVYEMTFTLDWSPLWFFLQEGLDHRVKGLAEKIITITGSATDAQAVTCLQYLSQT
jgi:hypothetical protein